jgi:hypothetical protein
MRYEFSWLRILVPPEDFFIARGIIRERSRRVSTDDMLAHLRRLGESVPVVSARAIDADEGMPSAAAYRSRFGGLLNAIRQAGLEMDRDYRYVEVNRKIRALHPGLIADLSQRLGGVGATVTQDPRTGLLQINGEYSAEVVLSRCRRTPAGSLRWFVRLDRQVAPDITVLARMDAASGSRW